MRLTDGSLRGRTVIAADGQALGAVESVTLDSASWRVETVQVRLRKEVAERIGAERSFFHASTLDVPVNLIQSVGDAMVLSAPVDGLRTLLPSTSAEAPAH